LFCPINKRGCKKSSNTQIDFPFTDEDERRLNAFTDAELKVAHSRNLCLVSASISSA
jgi:hypothetical protein